MNDKKGQLAFSLSLHSFGLDFTPTLSNQRKLSGTHVTRSHSSASPIISIHVSCTSVIFVFFTISGNKQRSLNALFFSYEGARHSVFEGMTVNLLIMIFAKEADSK
ncbi:hypothetical protein VNO77_05259 [Canavalia gladiata]|uniref:Uncharacterized protein n=1 Tax=Canavalia gladiata TaxID=3824 RepID=A0AAN9N3Q5_CANGL